MLRWFLQSAGERVPDDEIARRLAADPDDGWRVFIDAYTPTLLALIERAGVVDRDEAMDVYTRVCARLTDNGCAALRRRDPSVGSLAGWLAAVVRGAAVDYVRSQIGRRRMFAAVQALDHLHQRVFELYYWDRRSLSEVTELLRVETNAAITIDTVLQHVETLDTVLTERHRADLLALVARSRAPVSLDGVGDDSTGVPEPVSDLPDPEAALRIHDSETRVHAALAGLPAEDAAIMRLKFEEGLTRAQIQRLLRMPELTEHRVRAITATLRARLSDGDQPPSTRPPRAIGVSSNE